jgi:hypothetical protein
LTGAAHFLKLTQWLACHSVSHCTGIGIAGVLLTDNTSSLLLLLLLLAAAAAALLLLLLLLLLLALLLLLLLLQTRMKLDEKKASDYLRRFLAGDPSIKLPRLSFALQVRSLDISVAWCGRTAQTQPVIL